MAVQVLTSSWEQLLAQHASRAGSLCPCLAASRLCRCRLLHWVMRGQRTTWRATELNLMDHLCGCLLPPPLPLRQGGCPYSGAAGVALVRG